MDPEFTELVDLPFEFDVDETNRDEFQRALYGVVDDKTIDLLRRQNRVGIARGTPFPVDSPSVPSGRSMVDVPMLFALQAHPDCLYRWARIVIDLGATDGAIIHDMSPRDVQDIPVEVTTTVGADLSLSVAAKAVDIGVKPEMSRRRTVFFPTVAASGVGFRKAYWDFYAKAGDYLHADKELHLLVDAPADVAVMARITVRAKVRFRGLAHLIPLLARTGGYDSSEPVQLA
jgi:hypothetical protein